MDYFERQLAVQYILAHRANLLVIRLVTKNCLTCNSLIYMVMNFLCHEQHLFFQNTSVLRT